MESISWEHILLAVVLVAIVVYGILVFRGNRKCFGVLAGGGDFLALNPSDEVFMKEARRSGAAVCLVAVVIGGSLLGQGIQDNEALRMACLVSVGASVAAIAVLVVLTMRTQFKLSKERHEQHR